ncbi:CIA30 family protein-like protein [Truncatella angustata]|uniref:CIA30 family protein-like protein n=1 Tax=Truncatella angustata TaxID=152316 RepID=A0A9P8RKR5_9PEZI|nr:CIA30 family protein-like protein [Truncatella angustata]KAH6647641.1 CIA30 family protein-like protein [Truncatella angustata]KAH8204328.1 hypothetical protein TruAng_001491 [Truncatella angustata]
MAYCASLRDLFGASAQWDGESWTSSDDRVRGGKSQSYLQILKNVPGQRAVFHGNLDIKTLGGAGFASQRTTDERKWDLSGDDAIVLKTGRGDGKKYTLVLKDEALPKRPDGREQSTVSWEYDFKSTYNGGSLYIPWSDFKPTYRGKPKSDARPLDLKSVQRISIMMRSFFGEQEGPFWLEIESISAHKKGQNANTCPCVGEELFGKELGGTHDESSGKRQIPASTRSWKSWLCF